MMICKKKVEVEEKIHAVAQPVERDEEEGKENGGRNEVFVDYRKVRIDGIVLLMQGNKTGIASERRFVMA